MSSGFFLEVRQGFHKVVRGLGHLDLGLYALTTQTCQMRVGAFELEPFFGAFEGFWEKGLGIGDQGPSERTGVQWGYPCETLSKRTSAFPGTPLKVRIHGGHDDRSLPLLPEAAALISRSPKSPNPQRQHTNFRGDQAPKPLKPTHKPESPKAQTPTVWGLGFRVTHPNP